MTDPKPNSFEVWFANQPVWSKQLEKSARFIWQASRTETLRECLALLPKKVFATPSDDADNRCYNQCIDEMRARIEREL